MTRKLPLVPTLVVALAAAAMIALGIWQMQRAGEKEALLDRYRAAQNLPPVTYPTTPLADEALPLFRHSTVMCLRPVGKRVTAGRNRAGESGHVIIADCATGAEGPGVAVELGWSKDPNAAYRWSGGLVSGIIAPDRRSRMRLVASEAPQGLQPSAPPSTDSIPNNHRLYAVQWFLFSGLAVLIYWLALRRRFPAQAADGPADLG